MAIITVKQSDGDYSTLSDALDNANVNDTISIEGTWTVDDSTTCTVADSGLTITTDADSKCDPFAVSSPSHYRLRTSSGHSITISYAVTIEGVEIGNTSTTTSDECIRIDANSITLTCTDCILYFTSRNDQQDLIYGNNRNSLTVVLTNCIGWNAYRAAVDIWRAAVSTADVDINSCHFYDCGYSTSSTTRSGVVGIDDLIVTPTVRIFNSLMHINTGNPVTTESSDGSVTIDRSFTNASAFVHTAYTGTTTITDSTTSATWAETGATDDYVVVEDLTTSNYKDLRLVDDTDNDAQDAHADGSGAGLTMPSTDIAGTTRPVNTNYDIGAYEIPGAAVTTSIVINTKGAMLGALLQL